MPRAPPISSLEQYTVYSPMMSDAPLELLLKLQGDSVARGPKLFSKNNYVCLDVKEDQFQHRI